MLLHLLFNKMIQLVFPPTSLTPPISPLSVFLSPLSPPPPISPSPLCLSLPSHCATLSYVDVSNNSARVLYVLDNRCLDY